MIINGIELSAKSVHCLKSLCIRLKQEDALNSAIAYVLEQGKSFSTEKELFSYLSSRILHHTIDIHRHQKVVDNTVLPIPKNTNPDISDLLFNDIIAHAGKRYQRALTLRFKLGYTLEEIGAEMNWSTGYISRHITKGLKELKKKLDIAP